VVIDQGGSMSMLCLIAFVVCPLLTVVNVQSKPDHACNKDQLFGVLIILIQL
jgi:hypothetical protein